MATKNPNIQPFDSMKNPLGEPSGHDLEPIRFNRQRVTAAYDYLIGQQRRDGRQSVQCLDAKISTGVHPTAPSSSVLSDSNRMAFGLYRRGNEKMGSSGIYAFKTDDSGSTYTDINGVNNINSLDTLGNGDWLIIGHDQPFHGVYLDMNATNDTASLMTVKYSVAGTTAAGDWNTTGLTNALLTLEDNSDSAGDTLKVDGNVMWGKADANRMVLRTLNNITAYWVQIQVSVQLDATVSFTGIHPLSAYSQRIDVSPYEWARYTKYDDDGTFTDFDKRSGTDADSGTTDDFIYVGSDEPFTGIYCNSISASDQASLLTVDLYKGDTTGFSGGFTDANGLIDDASIDTGKTLAQDGVILWDNAECARMQKSTVDSVYAYWARLSWSATLGADTEVGLYTVRGHGQQFRHRLGNSSDLLDGAADSGDTISAVVELIGTAADTTATDINVEIAVTPSPTRGSDRDLTTDA